MKTHGNKRDAFTLVEMLVAVAILMVILVVLLEVSARVGALWKSSAGRVTSFQSARAAFDAVTRSISQATLNTYFDYVDKDGNYRDPANPSNFSPTGFRRASELHFLSGSAAALTGNSPALSPGHAIFFQAPLDLTQDSALEIVPGLLNATGFFIAYAPASATGLLPSWLSSKFGNEYQFQLRHVIQPTEENQIYETRDGWGWVADLVDPSKTTPGTLADNIVLLVIRPRLSPQDEIVMGPQLGTGSFDDSQRGSILCPNYSYNSRAWQTDASFPLTVTGANRMEAMRNQIAPIVDLAMVAIDPQSLERLDMKSATPPEVLTPDAGAFTDSAKLDEDLLAFEEKLSAAKIRFRTFRTSVPVQSSKWSNSF